LNGHLQSENALASNIIANLTKDSKSCMTRQAFSILCK
jgi:hypothetical protein